MTALIIPFPSKRVERKAELCDPLFEMHRLWLRIQMQAAQDWMDYLMARNPASNVKQLRP